MPVNQFPELQVLSLVDLPNIQAWSKTRADTSDPFAEWSAPWRGESLQHYLANGWSLFRRNPQTGEILGYVLAQPILFFRGQTQTVWVEYVDALTPSIKTELLDTVVRIAREKHMQRVIFTDSLMGMDEGLGDFICNRSGRAVKQDMIEIATTKS